MKDYQKAIDSTKELIELETKKLKLLKELQIGLELKQIKQNNPESNTAYRIEYTRKGTKYVEYFTTYDDMEKYERKNRLRFLKHERRTFKLPESA